MFWRGRQIPSLVSDRDQDFLSLMFLPSFMLQHLHRPAGRRNSTVTSMQEELWNNAQSSMQYFCSHPVTWPNLIARKAQKWRLLVCPGTSREWNLADSAQNLPHSQSWVLTALLFQDHFVFVRTVYKTISRKHENIF